MVQIGADDRRSVVAVARVVAGYVVVGVLELTLLKKPGSAAKVVEVVVLVLLLGIVAFARRPTGHMTERERAAYRKFQLDPGRASRHISMYVAIVLFAVNLLLLLCVAFLGTGTYEMQESGWSAGLFAMAVAVALGAGMLATLKLGRAVGPSMGRHDRGTLLAAKQAIGAGPAAGDLGAEERHPALAVQWGKDVRAEVVCSALAGVLADRLNRVLPMGIAVAPGDEWIHVAPAEGPSQRGITVNLHLDRFRLEPPPDAVVRTARQVMRHVQEAVARLGGTPWPKRADHVATLLDTSAPAAKVCESNGVITMAWSDEMGAVLTLDPFALSDVLAG